MSSNATAIPPSQASSVAVDVLAVGFTSLDLERLRPDLEACRVIQSEAKVSELMKPISPRPEIVLVTDHSIKVELGELAQILRMSYPEATLCFLSYDRTRFNRESLIKNGATAAYLLPIEMKTFQEELSRKIRLLTEGSSMVFHPVKVVDVKPGMRLDFSIYLFLPLNQKYVKFLPKGEALDEQRVAGLLKSQHGNFFVEEADLEAFNLYAAQLPSEILDQSARIITLQKTRLKTAVRDYLTRIFKVEDSPTVERGKQLTAECYQIVQEHVLGARAKDWPAPLLTWAGEVSDIHQHAANIALYSTLIAERLGMGNLDSIAAAALLHDVGLARLETNERDDPRYRRHPEYSIKFLKARKFAFPELVYRIIQQHHERQNGRGYPFGIGKNILAPESTIVGLCDEIDYRIQFEEGKAVKGPGDILLELKAECMKNPQQAPFDPDWIERIIKLFPETKK